MKKSIDLGEFLRPKPDKNLNEWGYEIVKDKEVFTVKLKTQVRKQNSIAAVLWTTYEGTQFKDFCNSIKSSPFWCKLRLTNSGKSFLLPFPNMSAILALGKKTGKVFSLWLQFKSLLLTSFYIQDYCYWNYFSQIFLTLCYTWFYTSAIKFFYSKSAFRSFLKHIKNNLELSFNYFFPELGKIYCITCNN